MSVKKKTSEEIMKANLNRMLNRLKTKVAEKEELWIDVLQDLLPLVAFETELEEKHVRKAAELADVVLEELEKRWGK